MLPEDESQTFAAVQGDFQGFTEWTRFDLGASTTDGVNLSGDRAVYLNHPPPHGSTSFPVGTILVKTIGAGTADAGPTFAMVKRGGGYNAAGAANWEWFELQRSPGGQVAIVWRGARPPTGDPYASSSPNACNLCHAQAAHNDFVPSAALDLSGF
jgi:hypothetical protein